MKSFHFDLGNSSVGPIGFCARIKAETPEAALEILKAALPQELAADDGFEDATEEGEVEYIRVYFNADAVTVANIDDEEDVDDEDGDSDEDGEEFIEIGGQYVFRSTERELGGPGHKERSGETVTVVRPLTEDESDVEGMLLVRFADGTEAHVFGDELSSAEGN